MTDTIGEGPYLTVAVDGHATVDRDGENQMCEGGNDSWSANWRHADRDDNLSLEASGSSDPAEFSVCPSCGRVYTNVALFDASAGGAAPAVAQNDTSSARFTAELARYDSEAYGDIPSTRERAAKGPGIKTLSASSREEEA